MIEVGYVVRRWNDSTTWHVDHVGSKMFSAHNVRDADDMVVFPSAGTHDLSGKLMPYMIVERPNSRTPPPSTDFRTEQVERLSYNCGAMEFELLYAWGTLTNALNGADADGDLRLKNAVGFVIESIEACADRLKPQTMTDGTVETPYLAAQIYANRK